MHIDSQPVNYVYIVRNGYGHLLRTAQVAFANPIAGGPPQCRVPSPSSPASGPISRSQNSLRSPATWATTASSWRAGATTSTSTAAIEQPGYVAERRALLERHGLQCHAISTHLVGQAVCDRIDERHQAILPPARLGRRRSRGCAPARCARGRHGAAEAGARVRCRRRQRLHRLEHLALDLRVPADEPGVLGGRLRATSPSAWTPILDAFDEAGRQLRARGAPDRDRVRHRLVRARARSR